MVLLTSRISVEMVQKTASIGASVMVCFRSDRLGGEDGGQGQYHAGCDCPVGRF
jgi:hypothetical protein